MTVNIMDIYQSDLFSHKLMELMRLNRVSEAGISIMTDKFRNVSIVFKNISLARALVLKQESLLCGADCALPEDAVRGTVKDPEVILTGNLRSLSGLSVRLQRQEFLYREKRVIDNTLDSLKKKTLFEVRGCEFRTGNTHIMGVLNVTPDSFSDGGEFIGDSSAERRIREMIADGVDIIDVGGESSRPGAERITVKEELERVIPKIRLIRRITDIPISIDTCKPEVANSAFREGADMLNYIKGHTLDDEMISVIKRFRPPVFLMHMRGEPENMQQMTGYKDIIPDVLDEISESYGVLTDILGKEKVIIDPGIGFGKSVQENWDIINRVSGLRQTGAPLLMGVSRKSFIRKSVQAEELPERDLATLILSVLFTVQGVEFVRVHNTYYHGILKQILKLSGVK